MAEENINVIDEELDEEFYVEAVLNHRGSTRKNMEFFIKWLNFDQTYNSWEPWNSLRDNEYVNQYLILIGQQNLILKKYRNNYPFVYFTN
jgi:hypothetical protein